MQAKDIKVGKEYAVAEREGPVRIRVIELQKPERSYYSGRGKTRIIGVKLNSKTGAVVVDAARITVYSEQVRGEWAVMAKEIEAREHQLEDDRRKREDHEARLRAVATALGVTQEDLAYESGTYWQRKISIGATVQEERSTIILNLPFAEELVRRLGLEAKVEFASAP